MPPKIFGIEHIIYLVISFVLIIAGLVLIGIFCKTEKAKFLAVKISGLVLFIMILINRYACTLYWPGCNFLPASLCGTVSMLLGIIMIFAKKDSKWLHSIAYVALLAGLITSIYPTYIGQGDTIFCFPTITSLIHHSLDIFCAILLFMKGWVKPDIKKWASWPIMFAFLIVYGLFMMQYMGEGNPMNINAPIIAGTIFNWFWLGLLFTLVYTVFLILYDVIKNKKNCFIFDIINMAKQDWKDLKTMFAKKEKDDTAKQEEVKVEDDKQDVKKKKTK